jgi:tRNA(Ile)-lysidine synthase
MPSIFPWTNLHARLHQTLRDRHLLPPQSRVLIALSGGQDSLCLTQLLIDLRSRWQWDLTIAHCDHGWPQDLGIVEHVRAISHHWDLPLSIETAVNLPETEAAARQWRYQALVRMAIASQSPYIVTAHTQSDRAETLLYNLIRGAGADGLSAMNWVREIEPGWQLVRPLLEIDRSTTAAFCRDRQLPIWPDVYNFDPRYARVRLRESIMPQLRQQFHPQVETHLARTAELLRAETEYLHTLAQEIYTHATENLPEKSIDRQVLKSAPLALQRRAVKIWLNFYLPSTPSFEAIEATITLINAPQGTRTSTLCGGAIATVKGQAIELLYGGGNS